MRTWFYEAVAVLASLTFASSAFAADAGAPQSEKSHHLLIQVDQNDPAVMISRSIMQRMSSNIIDQRVKKWQWIS